jgi:7-carboxy-7-deazaguanine synthase
MSKTHASAAAGGSGGGSARAPRLRVNEIFHSIQGEGTRVGRRCVFVRLTGCHLRCTYCDTEYAFYEGDWKTLDEILAEIRGYGCPFVELTGGEPLLQPAAIELLSRLCDDYPEVAVETSGAVSIERVDPRVIRIVDVKTPGSGEESRNVWSNLALLTPRDEVKFVISDRRDYEWSRDVVRREGLMQRCAVLFSPVIGFEARNAGGNLPVAGEFELYRGNLDPRLLAEWILADRLDVQFSLQLHKFIWDPKQRGV